MRRKPAWHRALKVMLWTLLGLWASVIIVLQIALNSTVLSKVAARLADEYVDGSVSFSGIKASMLRSFPNLNVSVEDFSITYPHERYGLYDPMIAPGDSLYRSGWGTALPGTGAADTLAHFDRLSVSVNYLEALRGWIKVGHATLEHPRIFVHRYDSTSANWDIIRTGNHSGTDTSSFVLPPITIVKASLEKSPFAVYTSLADTLAAALSLDHLSIKSHHDHYDIDLDSKVRLGMNGLNRLDIPLAAKARFRPDFDKRIYALEKLKASVAKIGLEAEGMVDLGNGNPYIKASAAINEESVSEVTEYFGASFPVMKKLKTDARVSLQAQCDGYYIQGTGSLPPLEVHLEVPEAYLGWEGIDEKGRFDLELVASAIDGKLSANVPDLCLHINGADISLKGSAEDLLREDPVFKIDSRIHARLDSLTRFLPEEMGISAHGNLDGRIKGSFKFSQLNPYNFSKLGLSGSLVSDGIRVQSPKDSVSAFLGRTTISLGPISENPDSDAAIEASANVEPAGTTGISVAIDSLFALYGISTFIRGAGVRLSAHNSEDKTDVGKGLHPIHGHLDIGSAEMMDLDSCYVGVRSSSNVFTLVQTLKDGMTVPYLTLSSANKEIAVREGVNRFAASRASINVSAHPNATETTLRRNHLLDSLQKVYPEVQRDSLLRKAFSARRQRGIPDYLSEKEFEKKDIRISMGETVAKYIKEWDISGGFKINEGTVITPYFPLDNKLSGLSGRFSNNRLDLSGLTVRSGVSDISASGSLTGLKRALTTAKGRLNLNLNLSSEVIDLNELFLAMNAGKQFVPPGANTALDGVDDMTYLNTVKREAALDTSTVSPLIVLPANLNAKINLQAGTVRYSDLQTSYVSGDLEMKERCMQVTNTLAMTNMGEVFFEGFYSTRTKKDLKAGFDLMLSNITAEKVIQLFPAVDSIMPMLKAFKGLLDCELAATTSIDTAMNIVLPSLSGMVKIDGKNLSLAESSDLDKLRKTLMFKDKDSSHIDAMSVRGIVKDNQLEVFPFILKVDRYTMALNGIQQFDQKFKYHVAAIKSPVPFRFGVNLKGNFLDWKWYLGKARYKSTKIPLFDDQIDELRLNLVNSIHNIYSRGVEHALLQNEKSQEAIEEKKAEISYSADETEGLSEAEKKALETLEKITTGNPATEGEVKEES